MKHHETFKDVRIKPPVSSPRTGIDYLSSSQSVFCGTEDEEISLDHGDWFIKQDLNPSFFAWGKSVSIE
tara:strand:- start:403 stop:609 length:207 start_codon:yes stop_codon:yes gene_type:complete